MKSQLSKYFSLKTIAFVIFGLYSIEMSSQITTITTPGVNTYTVPSGVSSVNVQIWGSGGSGGGCSTSGISGSGAGGGAYSSKTFNVTPGDIISYSVGAGAIATTVGSNGNDGNTTTLTHSNSSTSMIANGGNKGYANSTIGGAGGTSTGGTININGTNGGAGGTSIGGNGGNSGNTTNTGGAGTSNSNGTSGVIPGGGGGGGEKGTSNVSGGAGANGQIIITCNPTISTLSSNSGCVGSIITINGTNFFGITAANVKIGGTPVTSISYTSTSITAVIGSGSTGFVTVTTTAGTATSTNVFTVNQLPVTPVIVSPTNPTSICNNSGTSISLNATSTGNTINWFTTATGGTSIGSSNSGSNFSVSPTNSITYYAESVNASGCKSSTRAISATINVITPAAIQIEFTQGANDKTSIINSPCVIAGGGGQNDLDIFSGNPGGAATFQWQVSYNNGSTWSNALGPTSTTTQYVLDPNYTIYQTTIGVYKFRLIITNSGCSSISDVITLTNNAVPNLTAGTISGTQSYCTTTTPTAFTQTSPTGGLVPSSYSYQWQQSPNGTSSWVNVVGGTGGTSALYTPPSISTTTYYRRIVVSGTCTAISNTIAIYIAGPIVTLTNPSSVCSSANSQTTSIPYSVVSGIPSTYTITWNASPVNSFLTISNASITSNTITIAIPGGTLPGSYTGNITFKNSVGCVSSPLLFTVTVIPNITASVSIASTATTICTGTSVTFTTTPVNGGVPSYQWKINGISVPGETFSTFTTSSLVNNDIVSVIMNSTASPCLIGSPVNSNTITMNVLANPVAPVIQSVVNQKCTVSTGSITITNLPSNGNWILTQNGTSNNSIVGNGSTITIDGLIIGSYNFLVTNSNGCSSPVSNNAVIYGLTTTTWNGNTWSNGLPDADKNIVFSGSFSSTGTMEGCSCTVNSGDIVISANNSLIITNEVKATSGSLTFENNASLIQLNSNAVNSGNITYKRNVDIKQYDYVYWSSPVNSFNINNLSLTQTPGPKYKWNPTSLNSNGGQGNWESAESNVMIGAKGYIVRAPGTFNSIATTFTASFVGVPNNGTIPIQISRGSITGSPYAGANGTLINNLSDNWNLIGNPYPSSIRANQFLLDNQSIIEGGVRIWVHGSSPSNIVTNPFYSSYSYNYTPNDYLTYNFTGSSAGPIVNDELFIGAGQGFFVQMKEGPAGNGTVNFNNNLRDVTYSNNNFYKSGVNSSLAQQKDRIWLDLINSNNVSDRTLIGYIDGATNFKDNLFDSPYNTANITAIYSIVDNELMNIQGRALPFESSDVVPIGINITTAGNHKIAIGALEGIFDSQDIYLEDLYTNTIHNLKLAPYSFSSVTGTFNNRFVLRYLDGNLSNIANSQINKTLVVIKNNQLEVQSSQNIAEVSIYDFSGKLILKYNPLEKSEFLKIDFNYEKGIYFSKIKLDSGILYNQKISN